MDNISVYENQTKFKLSDNDRKKICDCADMLIESFDMIKSVETGDAEPMYTVLNVSNVFREDSAVKTIPREELLANAPARSGGYFQVPKTI